MEGLKINQVIVFFDEDIGLIKNKNSEISKIEHFISSYTSVNQGFESRDYNMCRFIRLICS